jgi:hypothetical protein
VTSFPGCPGTSPTPCTPSLQDYILGQLNIGELKSDRADSKYEPAQAKAQVCISFPSTTSNVGDPVKVTVSVNYGWLHFTSVKGGIPASTPITGSATMRLEAPPNSNVYSAGCSA